jgi:MFS family permease
LLGLVEALPALSLSLFGGHLADRRDRRSIYFVTEVVAVATIGGLGLLSLDPTRFGLLGIFAAIFVVGMAAGFQRPALTALEAQVIPVEHMTRGTSLMSGTGQLGGIIGPAVGGILYAVIGVTSTYMVLAALSVVTLVAILLISPKPLPPILESETLRESLASGIRYVRRSRILLSGMSLDLFAVLFGGAVAMLPIFASDILHVGPIGLGLMRTAPSIGALLAFGLAAWRPPNKHAGATLLVTVAGFGVSIIVFALSTNFALSLIALFMTGFTDGISVVIRSIITRLASPENLRARIASVEFIFIGASNEIGAFESGFAAKLLGVVPSVALGGLVTLTVVGIVGLLVPELRRLDFGRPLLTPDLLAAAEEEVLARTSTSSL